MTNAPHSTRLNQRGFAVIFVIILGAVALLAAGGLAVLGKSRKNAVLSARARLDFSTTVKAVELALTTSASVCGPGKSPFYTAAGTPARYTAGSGAGPTQSDSDSARIVLNPGGATLQSLLTSGQNFGSFTLNPTPPVAGSSLPAGIVIKRSPADTGTGLGPYLAEVTFNATRSKGAMSGSGLSSQSAPIRLLLTVDGAGVIQSCAPATSTGTTPPICTGAKKLYWDGSQWKCVSEVATTCAGGAGIVMAYRATGAPACCYPCNTPYSNPHYAHRRLCCDPLPH